MRRVCNNSLLGLVTISLREYVVASRCALANLLAAAARLNGLDSRVSLLLRKNATLQICEPFRLGLLFRVQWENIN